MTGIHDRDFPARFSMPAPAIVFCLHRPFYPARFSMPAPAIFSMPVYRSGRICYNLFLFFIAQYP